MSESELSKKYKKLSPIEHVLLKPGMYVGDIDFRIDKQLIYDENKIILKEISWSPGLYKIFDEIIVNAYDQNIRDSTLKNIEVKIEEDNFSCFNDGIGIDVEKHPEHKIYIPELIFANLMTSTNYDEQEERVTGGTHGLGAKLTAIFSKKFIIEVWDKKRKLYYHQIIEDNLSKINKPTIEKIKPDSKILGGVKITVHPDFQKFKTDKFNAMIFLLYKRVVDLIGLVSSSVKIKLNNIEIKDSSWTNYLMYYKDDWIIGNCGKSNKIWEFAIRFNNNDYDQDTHISFVNGIFTSRGGKHLDYFIDLILPKLQKLVSPELTKKLVKDYLNIALKTSIVNPSFSSQTKEELMTPPSKFGGECDINNKFWELIKESDIINNLKQVVSLSSQKILSKLEGSKKNKIKGVTKLEDANFAGTKKSMECTLILTEGDSAKATAISGISAIKDGRNFFGVFPLRGKLLNVREATTSQTVNNQEINDIKKIMGLKSGVKREDLRYGSILLMMDADEDGSHIKGLLINFLDYFYSHLMEEKGFLKILVTPVIKASLKDVVLSFQNLRAYGIWKEKRENEFHDSSKWNIKYYKGLGTSTSKEAQEYFVDLVKNTIDILDTQKQGPNPDILLAFGKEKVNDRKVWLSNYNAQNILQLEPPMTITIKQFVNQELIHFSNYDNIRSIPSIIDGFKPSQRKVIYACLKKNLTNEMKVAQLSGSVAEITAYHHGEQSLVGTIINLAQNFVGSNNINLLEPIGQFGTRLMGGKDNSSARYIFTKLTDMINKLIKKEDDTILEYLDDDGFQIEPKNYYPIIPLCLVNGAEGIGTGFSTSIPNFKLEDIVQWFKNKITGEKNKELSPYYNNFKGRIIKYDDTTWISEGILEIQDNKIIISELPVKLWTSDYKDFLELFVEEKDSPFKNYQNLSSDTEVKFILKIEPDKIEYINKLNTSIDPNGMNDLYKLLHLYKTLKVSNLTLYNTEGKLNSYKSVKEILEEFYNFRLKLFEDRRLKLIELLEKDKQYYQGQVKFIELVMSNNKIFKMDEDKMNTFLGDNKIKKYEGNYDYVTNLSFKQLNQSNLDRLYNKIKEIDSKMKELNNKSSKDLWLLDLESIL
jgi:DNA topoisomerase-2